MAKPKVTIERNDGKRDGFKRWTLYVNNVAMMDVEATWHSEGVNVTVVEPSNPTAILHRQFR